MQNIIKHNNLKWLKTGFNLDTVRYSLAFCRQVDCRRNSWICFVCWLVPEKVARNKKQIHHATFHKSVKLLWWIDDQILRSVFSKQQIYYYFQHFDIFTKFRLHSFMASKQRCQRWHGTHEILEYLSYSGIPNFLYQLWSNFSRFFFYFSLKSRFK